ncbi:MAG: helix-turn-helix transcriptional regulator [Rickettsiales bacterium]|nr:helix-turn-helix transcriptional regulator [Rickettsiales bacterium]
MVKNTNELDKIIGAKIVSARIMHGLNRKALADNLGITHQQLQKYEKGYNRISASRLAHIAEILNLQIEYFYTETKEEKSLREEGSDYDIGSINEIMRLTAKIKNKTKLDAIKNLIKSMSSE